MKLEIVLITYNRSEYLNRTLGFLEGSVLGNYKITILDNCSVDDTSSVVSNWLNKMPNMFYQKHKNNIGLGANIIRALEISNSAYTWVLCDDDTLNLSNFDDVLRIIEGEQVDLIHVGGHKIDNWMFGGDVISIKKLIESGYPYFRFSSFLPANIIKTSTFQTKYLISGYANVSNAYPHMPYLFSLYEADSNIYVSMNQCVTAKNDGQSYDSETWFYWWMKTCELLQSVKDVRRAFFDQWNDGKEINYSFALNALVELYLKKKDVSYLSSFISRFFSIKDKFLFNRFLYQKMKAVVFTRARMFLKITN